MTTSFLLDRRGIDEASLGELAARLWPSLKAGDIIALVGDLGSGKTSFSRALIRAALSDDLAEVPSPTFTLYQTYKPPQGPQIVHADLYRLDGPEGFDDLGLEDECETSVCLVEWPDRMPADMLANALWLRLTHDGRNRRLEAASQAAEWRLRLSHVWPVPAGVS